jgi:hypothetical protein
MGTFGLGLFFIGSATSAGQIPFQPGEELVYRIRWSFIPAGTAVLKVLDPEIVNGQSTQHFSVTVKSNRFVDSFYKVRSQIDGWTDMAVSHSLLYKKKQNEGRHRRDVVVIFDWDSNQAQYIDYFRGKVRSATLMPGTFDPFSAVYYFRTLTIKKDDEIVYPVSDGKKCVLGRGRAVKREKINIKGITYDTWVVVPEIKHLGGVFKKSKNAKIRFWITADHRRLPVKIASKVVVGSFIAELIKSSGTIK